MEGLKLHDEARKTGRGTVRKSSLTRRMVLQSESLISSLEIARLFCYWGAYS